MFLQGLWRLVQMSKESILRGPLGLQSHSCKGKSNGSGLYEFRYYDFWQYRSEHVDYFLVNHLGRMEWLNVHDDGFGFSCFSRHILHSSYFLRVIFLLLTSNLVRFSYSMWSWSLSSRTIAIRRTQKNKQSRSRSRPKVRPKFKMEEGVVRSPTTQTAN